MLFKYIAKEDKAYLKIDFDKFGGGEFNPSKILAEQSEIWSQYWAPKGVEGDKTKSACYECMDILRDLALTESANFSFSVDDFRRGLKGYNRTSKGVDLFNLPTLKICLTNSFQALLRQLKLVFRTYRCSIKPPCLSKLA